MFVLFASVSNGGSPHPRPPFPSLPSGWRLTCPTGWTTLAPTTKAGSITTMRTPPPAPVTTLPTGTEPMSTMTIIKLSLIQTSALYFMIVHLTLHSTLLYLDFTLFATTACDFFLLNVKKKSEFSLLRLQLIKEGLPEISCLSLPLTKSKNQNT